ncbi:MAG: thioredoxin-dependent thiol peroxidase [Bacteroidota bacterium]|nr:thioredoxin-dependent thiol peroxidase [Bacteroidota bacterium]MDP4272739.1 thioredoxin-dependent thiol peroxidase [Bacteroidota bacterium]
MNSLKEGDVAPAIETIDQDGNPFSLGSLKGKKVVLYFYPKDDTPGCTAEACNLRDNYSLLKAKGFEIVGISADSQQSHQKFSGKYTLPFTLIPDVDKKIIKAYGVWGEQKMYGKVYEGILRTTFIISEEGKIEKIFTKVETGNHTSQILNELSK